MAYSADKKPGELTALTTLASDDVFVVGDTSDASEVAKGITKANLVTDLGTSFEAKKGADDNYVTDAEKAIIAATTASYTTAEATKLGHISVTQAVDLDALETASHAAVTVADSTEIDLTLTGQQISAAIIAGSIDETKLDVSVNASLDLADSAVQTETDPVVGAINGIVKANGAGVISAAVAGTDYAAALGADDNYVTDAQLVVIGNTSGTNTGDEPSASDTVAGIVELATTAETNTGTDATRAVTPDALADSKFGNSALVSSINFVIDGGGSAITTGVKGYIEVPFACTINQVTLLADQSGSIVVDIWKDTYANYAPTDADSITASAPPTISSATKSQDSTLTGWTTSISAGDILGFNVDSITTCQRVTLSLKVTRT